MDIFGLSLACLAFLGGVLAMAWPHSLIRANRQACRVLRIDWLIPGFVYSQTWARLVGMWMICIGVLVLWIIRSELR